MQHTSFQIHCLCQVEGEILSILQGNEWLMSQTESNAVLKKVICNQGKPISAAIQVFS